MQKFSKDAIISVKEIADSILSKILFILLENEEMHGDENIDFILYKVFNNEEYKEFIKNPRFTISYIEDLKNSIELEIKYNHFDQAIVLAVACIEHLLNNFYGNFLSHRLGYTDNRINKILSANNISDKLGELFYSTFKDRFPDELKNSIIILNKHRNKFIHYKMNINTINNYEETISLANRSKSIIEELEIFLDKKERILYPNLVKVESIMQRIYAGADEGT